MEDGTDREHAKKCESRRCLSKSWGRHDNTNSCAGQLRLDMLGATRTQFRALLSAPCASQLLPTRPSLMRSKTTHLNNVTQEH